MSTFSYVTAAAAVLLIGACSHGNDRPAMPANGTTLSSDPTAPSIDPSVTGTQPAQTPNAASTTPKDHVGGGATPGSGETNDGARPPNNGSGQPPGGGTGVPSTGTNGAPVGGLR